MVKNLVAIGEKSPPQFDRIALLGSCTKSVLLMLTLSGPLDRKDAPGSSSAPTPNFLFAEMRDASWASATECSCAARRLTIVTTSSPSRSVNVCKATLELHGTGGTFVSRLHPSLTGAPVCVESANAFNSSNRAFNNERKRNPCWQEGSRSWCLLVWKKTGCHRWCFVSTVSPACWAAFTAPALLASLLFFFVMRACNRRCLELVWHGFVSEGLVVLVGDLRSKWGNRVEFLRLCSFETCQCAKHCANVFVDFGVLHCVHQCVWVRAAWLCDSAAVSSLPKGATNVVFSSISWVLCCCCWLVSRELLPRTAPSRACCAADCSNHDLCQWFHWAELAGSGVVVLNSCSATMYGLRVLLRFIGLIRYIGHPQPPQLYWARCQPGPTRVALHPGRMMEKPERQPYIHWTTYYEYRVDVDNRRVKRFLPKEVLTKRRFWPKGGSDQKGGFWPKRWLVTKKVAFDQKGGFWPKRWLLTKKVAFWPKRWPFDQKGDLLTKKVTFWPKSGLLTKKWPFDQKVALTKK